MSTFVVNSSRVIRLSGGVFRVGSGQTYTIVEDAAEYVDPNSREISRDLVERYFPHELPPVPVDPDPVEYEEDEEEEED